MWILSPDGLAREERGPPVRTRRNDGVTDERAPRHSLYIVRVARRLPREWATGCQGRVLALGGAVQDRAGAAIAVATANENEEA